MCAEDYRALVLRLESDLPTKVSGEVVNSLNGMLPAQIQTEFGAMRRFLDVHPSNQETALASVTSNSSSLGFDHVHEAIVSQVKEQNFAHVRIQEAVAANTAEIGNLRTLARAELRFQPSVEDAYCSSSPDLQPCWQDLRFHLLKCRILAPHILLFLRRLQLASSSLPLRLTGGDCIFFEDVLGRSKRLPYEYFRHAEIFEVFIRTSFLDVPGKSEVSDNKFRLLTSNGKQLSWKTWEKYAKPGVAVFMSIEKNILLGEQGHCPRCWEIEATSASTSSRGVTCSYCQLLYTRQPSICNIKFWTDPSITGKRKFSEVKPAEDDLPLDECSVNDGYQSNGSERSITTDSGLDEVMGRLDTTNDIATNNTDIPVTIRGSHEIAPFKRIYCTKSKDAQDCIERVIDLVLLIRSLMLDKSYRETEFLGQKTDVSADFEKILQRLLYLRNRFFWQSNYPDSLNSMTLVMLSLSAIHRLKQVLRSIRKSARFKFDIFLVMATFFVKVDSIVNLSWYLPSSKVPSLSGQIVPNYEQRHLTEAHHLSSK
ncbi:hypothetical protein MMC30_001785 [Trapelia coarctata]|nr:hypothetical protein [Trapelia coarctata]